MKKQILILSVLSFSTLVQAAISQEEDYDTIVNRLSTSTKTTDYNDPFESVQFHLGAGVSNSSFSIAQSNGRYVSGIQRGVQAAIGIDLFSRHWLAEATLRSFGEQSYDNSRVSLREFDLKLIYHTPVAQFWGIRLAGGLASRYMKTSYSDYIDVTDNAPSIPPGKTYRKAVDTTENYTTPASILGFGIETYVTNSITLAADIATRNSLIDETKDKSAMDFTIRLDGNF